MARRLEDMSKQEAREELERRHHPESRSRHGEESLGPLCLGIRRPVGSRLGAALMPPPYSMPGYGPVAPPWVSWRRDASERQGNRSGTDRNERDFLDRAGDEIAAWFGDEDAEARRAADHRGKGPKGYVRSDARIEEDVHDRLTDDPNVDASDIEVRVKDREVTLSGTVDSRFAKRAAEDCVDSVSGVEHCQNNLRLRSKSA